MASSGNIYRLETGLKGRFTSIMIKIKQCYAQLPSMFHKALQWCENCPWVNNSGWNNV